jgi:hypothetical protein
MHETVITCDRCGREFRGRTGDRVHDGWRLVFPLGVLSGARAVSELSDDELMRGPLHVCLDCLDPDEVEEIAAEDAEHLGHELRRVLADDEGGER